jgi:hypothetical protein
MLSATRTREIIEAYIAHEEPMLKAGRIFRPFIAFDEVMEAASNPLAFTGDKNATSALIDAIAFWETRSTLSSPFPHPNLTWVPSFIGGNQREIVSSLIDEDASTDLDVLCKLFVPADREIMSGWITGSQDIHELFLTGDHPTDRYCLLDPMNDCRMTRYPSGQASQPALEILEAARRAGTYPDIPIADRVEPWPKVQKLGWHMDLARVEAARILLNDSQASRRIGTGAERLLKRHKMPTVPVNSYSRLLDICRYVEEMVAKFGHGFSVWYRGQPNSYKRDRALGLDQASWRIVMERLKKRLHYLEDDDLLLPAFYRHYESLWQSDDGVHGLFHSLAAWQLVSDLMLFDADRFPTAPDVVLAEVVPPHILAMLERYLTEEDSSGFNTKMAIVNEPGRPGSLQDIELWAYHYIVVDGQEHFIFKRTHNEAQRNATSTLLLQHYGCPTGGLDITFDPERAAMFALGGFAYDRTGAIIRNPAQPHGSKPCMYVMLLKDDRDPFLRSTAMFKGTNGDNRIERQKCGILFGSSWACRNSAQRYIALKLELDFELPPEIDPRIVYPAMDEDPISRTVVEKFKAACESLDEHEGRGSTEARFPPSFVTSW